MTDTSARFALPHILPGQAQKEAYHNEALALIDGLLHPVAESRGEEVPPASPEPGQCWIVGASPSGDWNGRADQIALFTAGGWRFAVPVEGMRLWRRDQGCFARRTASGWIDGEITGHSLSLGGTQVVGSQQSAIADAAGGTVVDAEARTALAAVLSALRAHGLIAE